MCRGHIGQGEIRPAERWRSGRTVFFLVADDREIDGRTPDHSR
jgi:hypothetical protein